MLMGLCEVSKEGEVSLKGDMRVLYSVMMAIRMMIVKLVGSSYMGQASKIAIRYCCVRRQFSTLQGSKEERKVIDYQTTSFTGAKLISRYLTTTLAGNWCSKEF